MERKIKWGVLGTAYIFERDTAEGMRQAENCELYAIAGRSMEKAQHFKEKYGFQVAYGSYDDLINDPNVEAIYNPLPNTMHHEWTIKALRAGKHVLCEKPIACTAAEAEEMIAAAEKSGKLLMEAFMYRYADQFVKMMEILHSGVLGKIKGIQASQGYILDWASPAREDPALGGGSLYDVGCYVVDMMNVVAKQQGGKLVGIVVGNNVTTCNLVSANSICPVSKRVRVDRIICLGRRTVNEYNGIAVCKGLAVKQNCRDLTLNKDDEFIIIVAVKARGEGVHIVNGASV